jgi:hypothetical protein
MTTIYHCWGDKAKTNEMAQTCDENGTQYNSYSCPTLDTTWQEKKRQMKNNMEEDNYIRAGRNKFFYRPGSVRYKGQRKMATNC